MDEDRLIEMETKLAYQEKLIKELNDVVCEQQQFIDKLEIKTEKLAKLFSQNSQMLSGVDAPANEKPPHY